jgi:hypothetical protein
VVEFKKGKSDRTFVHIVDAPAEVTATA